MEEESKNIYGLKNKYNYWGGGIYKGIAFALEFYKPAKSVPRIRFQYKKLLEPESTGRKLNVRENEFTDIEALIKNMHPFKWYKPDFVLTILKRACCYMINDNINAVRAIPEYLFNKEGFTEAIQIALDHKIEEYAEHKIAKNHISEKSQNAYKKYIYNKFHDILNQKIKMGHLTEKIDDFMSENYREEAE